MARGRFDFDQQLLNEDGKRPSLETHLAWLREGLDVASKAHLNVQYYGGSEGCMQGLRLSSVPTSQRRILVWKRVDGSSVLTPVPECTHIQMYRNYETDSIIFGFIKENQVVPLDKMEWLSKEPDGFDSMVFVVLRKLLDQDVRVEIDLKAEPWFSDVDSDTDISGIITSFKFRESLTTSGMWLEIHHFKPKGLPDSTSFRVFQKVIDEFELLPRGDSWVLTFKEQP